MATATSTQTKVSTFKIKSVNNFISFLKRFSTVEKALLFELTPDNILAKSHTPDRSTIKYSKLQLNEVFDGTCPSDLLKIAILDINKVINVFKHFNQGDEIFLDIAYDDVNDETIAFSLKFYTKSLKITMSCADPITFTYVSGEALKRIIKSVADEKILEFPFTRSSFEKIESLCSIDSGDDLLKIKVSDQGKVVFKGKSFEYDIMDTTPGKEANTAFYNNQFKYIDQEDSIFHISQNKILVKSNDSDTYIVIGRTEK